MYRKPNLFVIGASKCGSTFLHDLLKQHPDIFMSEIKELHFFNKKISKEGLSDYLSNFSDSSDFMYAGESSPVYSETTYFKDLPKNIHEFNPDSRIIYIVRNPLKRLNSVYRQALSTGHHVKKMYYNSVMPLNYSEAVFLYPPFLEATKYHTHLENYRQYFADENIKVVMFEDLIKNTHETLIEIFRFLGVNDSINVSLGLAEKNSGSEKKLYNPWVDRLRRGLWGAILRKLPLGFKSIGRKFIDSILSKKVQEMELSEADKARVQKLLTPEVEGIYQYLSITNDPWNFFNQTYGKNHY
jgi:hypothetical protein